MMLLLMISGMACWMLDAGVFFWIYLCFNVMIPTPPKLLR